MIVGIPREIKPEEKRISITPEGVALLVQHGHQLMVEKNAGGGCGIADSAYRKAGAQTVRSARTVWEKADMILKVKEPLQSEVALMQARQIIFTFLHLAAKRKLTFSLLRKGVVGIAYETIQLSDGTLPILKPMSEIAGRLSVQLGAQGLEVKNGGRGVLLGGAPGVTPAQVTVLGGGNAGVRAAEVASGMGALVTILEISNTRVSHLRNIFGKRIKVERSSPARTETLVVESDLVIGAVLSPGAKAPHIITKEVVKRMKPGAVIVDIAVDQGGCCETIRPTTHAQPFYTVCKVVHCGITNLPSTVPLTSTLALTGASLPYICDIADKGYHKAAEEDPAIKKGINMVSGTLTNQAVAEAYGLSYHLL